MLRQGDDHYEGDSPPLSERPEVSCGDTLWVKVLQGVGCLKWWVSSDGKHWAIGDSIPENNLPCVDSIGMSTCRTKSEAGGTLVSIAVRELPAINGLEQRELIKRVPAPEKITNLSEWLAHVVETCPPKVELARWQRASAIAALGCGVQRAN